MDNFQIVKLIGKGAFGRVYKCLNTKNKKTYAIKRISVLRQSKEDNIGNLYELHILYHNTCPFILKYFSCEFRTYELSIVTKFCKYGDLYRDIQVRLKKYNYFEEKEIWKIFLQLSYGIFYLHKNNIIHRDLKTANIFLEKDNRIKIGDFGISKILDNTNLTDTQIGTPLYFSPELVKKQEYGTKTDMWSLGCILYEMLTLRVAFNSLSMAALCKKIKTASYLKLKNYNNYNKQLFSIVDELIIVDQSKRLSADDLLEKDIIKEKEYLGPYYDYTCITGNEIPKIEIDVPSNLNTWHKVSVKYQKRQKNYLTPDVMDKEERFKFNNKSVLPKIDEKTTGEEDFNNLKDPIDDIKEPPGMIKDPITSNLKEIRNQLKIKKKPIKQNYLSPVLNRRPYVSPYAAPYKSSYSKNYVKKQNYIKTRNEWENKNQHVKKNHYKFTNNIYNNRVNYNNYKSDVLIKIGSKHDMNYKNPFMKYPY